MAGVLSRGIKLSYNSGSGSTATWTEITNLQECPALGGSVDKVEVTTLSNDAHVYINGLKDYGDMEFKFLYDNSESTSNYRICKSLEGEIKQWKVEFPDALTNSGSGTTFTFNAQSHVSVDSQGTNVATTFTLSLSVNSDITIADPE